MGLEAQLKHGVACTKAGYVPTPRCDPELALNWSLLEMSLKTSRRPCLSIDLVLESRAVLESSANSENNPPNLELNLVLQIDAEKSLRVDAHASM